MSLFPGIKVDGHGYKEGLDPNGGSLQSVIEKNIFVEADPLRAFAFPGGPAPRALFDGFSS